MRSNSTISQLRRMADDKLELIKKIIDVGGTFSFDEMIKFIPGDAGNNGKSVGGLLSSLSRLNLPDIGSVLIPIGPDKIGSRRLRWKLNPSLRSDGKLRSQLIQSISKILDERAL